MKRLKVESITYGPFQENTYLVYNESGNCLIIDPGCTTGPEQKNFKDKIDAMALKPIALLNTHCHVDHIAGNRFVYECFGLAPLIHQEDKVILEMQAQVCKMYGLNCELSPEPKGFLKHNENLNFGGIKFKVIHTPGHAPGHVIFYFESEGFVINGDVLFNGSIGRTDLPFGDYDTLISSIKRELFSLPEETIVYCGHGPETNIGIEKTTNPFLS